MSNRNMWSLAFSVFTLTGLLWVTAAEAQWGTIKGQVIVVGEVPHIPMLVTKGDGAVKDAAVCAAQDIPNESLVVNPQSRGLANVAILLNQKPARIHPDLTESKIKEVVFKQQGCRFVPHVLLVRTDQRVRVACDDLVAHNVHPFPRRNPQFGIVVPPSDPMGYLEPTNLTKPESLPVSVRCDIHPWMQAYWVVLDHPYAAVSNEEGEFEIVNLPEGENEFSVWQEKAGYLEKHYKVLVKSGPNKLDPITVPAEKFSEK